MKRVGCVLRLTATLTTAHSGRCRVVQTAGEGVLLCSGKMHVTCVWAACDLCLTCM